ncbi:TIGR01906 family membrane protein [Clostridium uliginosum]|uniref:Integral membrane protein TIGR01906 n=1 Tax=Clostridium uliginosum TaxID=119641 RepID=A0A1I1PBH8_9CLOT|nr:TIGR01906 family membrane protein [Clostridium uliginosum]SFD06952.1 integral membrane protein TIGR01906 [Clostridium uliginosum]
MNNKIKNIEINKILNCFINTILGFFSAMFVLSVSVIITLNLTPIYRWAISKYSISEYTGLSSNDLMINYKGLIYYLQNPFIEKLQFQDFSMSPQGEIHFQDVKRIFMYMYIYVFVFMIALGIYLLIKDKFKNKSFFKATKILNSSSNVLILFFAVLIYTISVDFSKYFILFHKILFTNNYWLFDPELDPVINALPEEFFMLLGAIILILLIAQAIYFKTLYYKSRRDLNN